MNDRYREYLQSPEWQDKREAVRFRALGRCEFCGAAMAHVHHVKYPKNLGDEPLSDLLAVCKVCHDKSHGVRKMELELVPDPRPAEVKAPGGGRVILCVSINGNAYASIAAWSDALNVSADLSRYFEWAIESTLMGTSAPGRLPQAKFNGTRVISWQVVANALRATDRSYHNVSEGRRANSKLSVEQWRQMCTFIERIDVITQWGFDVQSQALAGRLEGAVTAPDDVHAKIALVAQGYMQHGKRIDRIESVTLRPGMAWVTVQEASIELGLDSQVVVRGGQNLGQAAGADLKAGGCEPGPAKPRRLDGIGITKSVNQWRRRDAFKALGELAGRDFTGLLVD